MSSSELLAPPEISEPLTWAEICARYPDQWVCLAEMDCVHPFGFEFRTARVIGEGKTRSASFEQGMRWRAQYPVIGNYFTGRIKARWLWPRVVVDDEA